MAIPTQIGQYARQFGDYWVKTDATTGVKSGPYITDDGVTFTLASGIGSYTGRFELQESGFFTRVADGLGPFVTADGTNFKKAT